MPTSSKLPSLTDFRTLPHPVCRQEVGIVSGLYYYNLSQRHKNAHTPRDTHNAQRTVIAPRTFIAPRSVIASRTVIAPRSVLVPCVLAITGGTPWKLSLNNDR